MGGNLGTALGGWKGYGQFTGPPPFCGRGPEARRGQVKAPEVAGRPGAPQGRDNSLLCRPRLCPCCARLFPVSLFQVTLSRVMNVLSAVAAAAGIILLVIGYLIDQDFFCGYAGEVSECQAVTTLFIVSVLHF